MLSTLGREELLATKVFAACDRAGRALHDCLAMKPTVDELEGVYAWVSRQDAHPDWPKHVRQQIDRLKEEVRRGQGFQ